MTKAGLEQDCILHGFDVKCVEQQVFILVHHSNGPKWKGFHEVFFDCNDRFGNTQRWQIVINILRRDVSMHS